MLIKLLRVFLPFALVLGLGAAYAQDASPARPSPLEPLFGNTVRITSEDGVVYIYFNRDGTFSSRGPGGDQYGTWRVVGEKICTKTRTSAESCGALQTGRTVGDMWEHTVDGKLVEMEIIEGR